MPVKANSGNATSNNVPSQINSSTDLQNFRSHLNYPTDSLDKPDKVGASSLSPVHSKMIPAGSPKQSNITQLGSW